MKKHILFGGMLFIAAAFTACTEDFKNWASPQSNGPEEAITIPGFTASGVGAQNLADLGEEVPTFSLSTANLPEGFELGNARIELTPAGIEDATTTIVNTSLAGMASKESLQDLIVGIYGKRPTNRLFNGHVLVNAIKDGQAVYIDAGNIEVNLIPEAPYIAQNYYIVGGTKDWAGSAASKEQKFSHSDADVYDDPIFSIVIDGNPDGDTWFAIGDDAGCDAITNDGDWSKLFGIVGGDSKATEGALDYRYNLGADNSFCVEAGAKKIKITIDMMEYTFTVTPVNISDTYYLIGGPGEWSAESAMTMQFSHSDKDVFEDPIFTYTFDGGSDMWFAFGDKEAIDAVAEGTWNQLFGTTGASEDLTGSFDRRYNLDGDHSFHIDGSAKMYRFTINMAEMTYEIKELNFNEYLWEAGVNNNWGADAQPLYCANQDGVYSGFFYAQDADWSGGMGAFKFTGAFNSWDEGNYGTGTINDDGLSGTLIDDGGSGNCLATPGFYKAEVNLAEMTYQLTPITGIGLIGPAQAGGWDTDTDLTFNPETRAWEGTIELAADEFKFRANDGWDINWGGTIDNLTQDGPNLKIETAGKYFIQFFPICETKSYAVITTAE
jgi:hypothetical protein